MDTDIAKTSVTEAYGEVVGSWRPVAGVKLAGLRAGDDRRKAVHQEEHDIRRNAISQGRPDALC